MFASTLASLALTCTTVFSNHGGDPHSREYVTRVAIDYQTRQALVREYSFEAHQAWAVESVEELLVDENLASKPFILFAETVPADVTADVYDALELSFDDSISSRVWSKLVVKRDGSANNEVNLNGRTYSESMICKFN
ncbi:MAG: hypothetical protein RIQ81_73 [Pseudomonadota bacterium]|jgi:hypothetical protein